MKVFLLIVAFLAMILFEVPGLIRKNTGASWWLCGAAVNRFYF